MVLLIVDTQQAIVNDGLYELEAFQSAVTALLREARLNGVEVIYVRHDGGAGDELEKGSPGFEIYGPFAPQAGERIFDKTVNSAFKESGLLEYLTGKGEREIVLAGLQTDYCIDATVKCGFEHGFHMIVPSGANTTVGNEFMEAGCSCRYYNEFIWKGRYAECISLEETVERLRGL